MKKLQQLLVLGLIFINAATYAQQALFGGQDIISPEIHENNAVTFRLLAPIADSVKVTGDFLPTVKAQTPRGEMDVPGKVQMTKDENGVWSFMTESLSPELYNYAFIVDGLTSTDPGNPFVVRDVATLSNMFIIKTTQENLYSVNDIPHGTISRRWYNSDGLKMDRRLTIYTPPGYESSDTNYPVLYLLHGAGGDEEAWMALGRTPQIMDNLLAGGKAIPMIVVMPNANVTLDAAPGEGSDGYFKPQFMAPKTMDGTYEANFLEIINFVESNYRVQADKAHRAIAGLSMGGFHAMHISRFYPNTFDYVGLFSAAIMPRNDATGKVYKDLDGTLMKQKENGYSLYWIAIGKTDFLFTANQEFRKRLDDLGMKYTYVETDGGHIWRNWRIYLSEFVPKLFKEH